MPKQNRMGMFLYCLFSGIASHHHHSGGHRSYGSYGSMGGEVHNAGTGTHRGDIGSSSIMFTQDVVHHGGGGLYIGKGSGDSNCTSHPLSVDDIHNQINKAKIEEHNAAIAEKDAQLTATKIKEGIAAEMAAKKKDELAMLESLDKQAAVLEKEKPEVLGKKVIPIVTFTEESNPLRHHVRMLNSRISEINETERKNIEAQKQLTRLDDITDKFKFNNVMIANPKMYSKFLAAGSVKDYLMDIPVIDNNGSFYIKPHSGSGSHAGQEHLQDYKTHLDNHSHFQYHGVHVPEKDSRSRSRSLHNGLIPGYSAPIYLN